MSIETWLQAKLQTTGLSVPEVHRRLQEQGDAVVSLRTVYNWVSGARTVQRQNVAALLLVLDATAAERAQFSRIYLAA